MKEFLSYILDQLNKLTQLHKTSEKLSDEDTELLNYLRGTVLFLETYAAHINDRRLYQIVDDMEYAISHMWVTFKAEAALKDVEKNISEYS